MAGRVCLVVAVYCTSAALAFSEDTGVPPLLAQGRSDRILRREQSAGDAGVDRERVHVQRAAPIFPHGPILDDPDREDQLRQGETAFAPSPFQASSAPGLIGLVVGHGSNVKGTDAVQPGSVDESKECADAMHTGRTSTGGSLQESCQEMMFTSRHAKVNACWDRHDGPTLRKNCRRTCSCCCGDQQGSGTHDSNGIEVTCRQLVQWTDLYTYDYCADATYGPAIRTRCQSLCCTCSPAMEWLASWDYTNSSAGGMRGAETGPQPLIELTDDVNEARRLVSELAENVDTIAGELPRLGALVVGGSRAATLQRPGARNPSLVARENAQKELEHAGTEFKDQWGAGDVPPPEAGETNATESPRWVTSPRVWSGTAQSETDAQASVPPPERKGEEVHERHDDATWVDMAGVTTAQPEYAVPQGTGVTVNLPSAKTISPYAKDLEGVDVDSNQALAGSMLATASSTKSEAASAPTATALGLTGSGE